MPDDQQSGQQSDGGDGSDSQTGAGTQQDQGNDGAKRALAAERRNAQQAARRADQLQARLDELENAGKTEAERLQGTLQTTTQERDTATATVARLEVALEKGLSAVLAKRLVGNTREELEADADELLKTFSPAATDDLDLGKRGGTPAGPQDMNSIIRRQAGITT